jgi:Flavin containing amine oxidoreductase
LFLKLNSYDLLLSQPKHSSLQVANGSSSEQGLSLRMSMGFQHFLQSTCLPNWFPLSNLQVGQQKVLSLLNMRKDHNGNVIWDDSTRPLMDSSSIVKPLIPMEPRSRYRVCVVGGGIAGLSCCLELFRICEKERIDVEVVLVEGRKRLGGRLWTDHETFDSFPVDLGASWIHGIDENPLAELAREAGAEFVTTSEDVKIFLAGMQEIDSKKDENAGKLFDEVLDLAVRVSHIVPFVQQFPHFFFYSYP